MLFKWPDKSSPLNSTHYSTLYPQNGDRIVATDSVTSLIIIIIKGIYIAQVRKGHKCTSPYVYDILKTAAFYKSTSQ